MMDPMLEWADRHYGKRDIKLLHVTREGPVHSINEFEITASIVLATDKDYIHGDLSDVIDSDALKNIAFILAKKIGVKTPEDFALHFTSYVLSTYNHVGKMETTIKSQPWRRMEVKSQPHNHAFISVPEVIYSCHVTRVRGEEPVIKGSLEGLKILKTTRSSFKNFLRDQYTILPEMYDRIMSTVVSADWTYNALRGVNFGAIGGQIKDIILEAFAGPPDGVHSLSLQTTIYSCATGILGKISQIDEIGITMPNLLNCAVDLSPFQGVGKEENKEVFLPVDKPASVVTARIRRKKTAHV